MCLAWFRCVRNSYWILSFGGFRNTGIPEYRNTGTSECRNVGVSECRSIGMSEHRNTGILSPESRKSSIPTFWKPLHFCSLLRGFNYSSVPGLRGFNYSGVPVLRGRNTLEHWRVPDAELSCILRRHLFLNFVLECVAIPWYPIDPLSNYLF